MRTSPSGRRAARARRGAKWCSGGRKVAIQRPRVRTAAGEVALPTFQTMAATDPLNRRVVEQMLVGVATRQYARSLEPLGPEMQSRGTSKSAVSRRFVAKTRRRSSRPGRARRSTRSTWSRLLIDGVHIGEHCLIVALGIAADGQKHALGPLGRLDGERDRVPEPAGESPESRPAHRPQPAGDPRWLEGAAQSGARDLRRRGPDPAVPSPQDCATSSSISVTGSGRGRRRSCAAPTRAPTSRPRNGCLLDLARRLETEYPSAAESVREGLDETLTVLTLQPLGAPAALARHDQRRRESRSVARVT